MAEAKRFKEDYIRPLLDGVRLGLPIDLACKRAGISLDTYNKWIKLGSRGVEPYKTLLLRVDMAEAESAYTALSRVIDASSRGQWQSSAWLLERRYPEHFSLKNRTEIIGSQDAPIKIVFEVADEKSLKNKEQKEEDNASEEELEDGIPESEFFESEDTEDTSD